MGSDVATKVTIEQLESLRRRKHNDNPDVRDWRSTLTNSEVGLLFAFAADVAAERDAYKRAKEENDERFVTERDAARAHLAEANEIIAENDLIGFKDLEQQCYRMTNDLANKAELLRITLAERDAALATLTEARAAWKAYSDPGESFEGGCAGRATLVRLLGLGAE